MQMFLLFHCFFFWQNKANQVWGGEKLNEIYERPQVSFCFLSYLIFAFGFVQWAHNMDFSLLVCHRHKCKANAPNRDKKLWKEKRSQVINSRTCNLQLLRRWFIFHKKNTLEVNKCLVVWIWSVKKFRENVEKLF